MMFQFKARLFMRAEMLSKLRIAFSCALYSGWSNNGTSLGGGGNRYRMPLKNIFF